jgi:hypothetical protein
VKQARAGRSGQGLAVERRHEEAREEARMIAKVECKARIGKWVWGSRVSFKDTIV